MIAVLLGAVAGAVIYWLGFLAGTKYAEPSDII